MGIRQHFAARRVADAERELERSRNIFRRPSPRAKARLDLARQAQERLSHFDD